MGLQYLVQSGCKKTYVVGNELLRLLVARITVPYVQAFILAVRNKILYTFLVLKNPRC